MDTPHDMNAAPTVRSGIRLALVLAQLALASAASAAIDPAQAPSPAPVTSAQAVLAQMLADRKSLNSYEVPSRFDIHVHKYITLHLELDGMRYFQRPDNEALHMHAVPIIAHAFQHIYLDVAGDNLAPLKAQWFYRNAGTIVMTIDAIRAGGHYALPTTEVIDIEFPDYSAHAVADYGDYQLNIAIPETIFSPQP